MSVDLVNCPQSYSIFNADSIAWCFYSDILSDAYAQHFPFLQCWRRSLILQRNNSNPFSLVRNSCQIPWQDQLMLLIGLMFQMILWPNCWTFTLVFRLQSDFAKMVWMPMEKTISLSDVLKSKKKPYCAWGETVF